MGDLGKFRELAPFWAPTVLLVNRQTGSKSPKLARGQNLRARPDRPETLQIDEDNFREHFWLLFFRKYQPRCSLIKLFLQKNVFYLLLSLLLPIYY